MSLEIIEKIGDVKIYGNGGLGGKGIGLVKINECHIPKSHKLRTRILTTTFYDRYYDRKKEFGSDELNLLVTILNEIGNIPISVRSSATNEACVSADGELSVHAGENSSFMLPNNHPDFLVWFHQFKRAIYFIYDDFPIISMATIRNPIPLELLENGQMYFYAIDMTKNEDLHGDELETMRRLHIRFANYPDIKLLGKRKNSVTLESIIQKDHFGFRSGLIEIMEIITTQIASHFQIEFVFNIHFTNRSANNGTFHVVQLTQLPQLQFEKIEIPEYGVDIAGRPEPIPEAENLCGGIYGSHFLYMIQGGYDEEQKRTQTRIFGTQGTHFLTNLISNNIIYGFIAPTRDKIDPWFFNPPNNDEALYMLTFPEGVSIYADSFNQRCVIIQGNL